MELFSRPDVEAVSNVEEPTVTMADGVTPTQHPDAGLLDSYVTIAGGSTSDRFDELTNLPDLEAWSADFEAELLRFTQAKPVALVAIIDVSDAEGSTGHSQAADSNFAVIQPSEDKIAITFSNFV